MWKFLKKINLKEAFLRKAEDGGPWVPSKEYALVFVPIATVVLFISNALTGYRGVVSPNEDGVSFSDIDWSALPFFFLCSLGLYYLLYLPAYVLRRKLWEKHQRD